MSLASDIQRLASLIRQLQGALNGRRHVDGTETLTFTASAVSGTVTVTHDLGVIPRVLATPAASTVKPAVFNKTTTTFDLLLRADSTITADVACDWHAIG